MIGIMLQTKLKGYLIKFDTKFYFSKGYFLEMKRNKMSKGYGY